jgi:DNA-binding transcriptional ArsR family regulator
LLLASDPERRLTMAFDACIVVQMSKCGPPACCAVPIESFGQLQELFSHHLFRAMGDPNRVRLLFLIIERCRNCTVSELAECLTIDVSVVSRHLAILRAAGVLSARRDGKRVQYSIQYQQLAKTLRGIADALEACEPNLQKGARRAGQGSPRRVVSLHRK